MILDVQNSSMASRPKPVILVVDDDPTNLAVIRDCLVEFDYTILVAEDGESAVQRADYARPDLILLDIMMPGIDGFETCRRLKASETTQEIPVLFMTALAETGYKVKGLESGAVDYITKPFQREELLARIAVHLHNKALTEKLKDAKELLEIRVHERTAELAQTIKALHEEILEHKRTEEELRKSEGHLRTLVQTIPDLVWLKDKHGAFLLCNPGVERLLGAEKKDIIGKTDYNFINQELADFFIERDQKAILKGESTRTEEWVVFANDGHRALLETIKTPMHDATGNLIGVLGIGRDITERKRSVEENFKLQAQLQQAQKMEAVGQLAGGVAHDFNNMLSVILGHAEIAMNRMDPSQPQFSDLEQIHKAAQRSANITRQLLTFARKQAITPRVIDLNETVEGMLKMLRRIIGEDIHFVWKPGYGLWPVNVDASQIDQIMANLCVNAQGAIEGVGNIIVETGNCTLDANHCDVHADYVPGDYVHISVSDDGCGIDEETLDHIFEPFFTTKSVGKGTGLGLATVYGIVKQNNGFIRTISTVGQGTTFTIYLPRYVGEHRQVELVGETASVNGGNETILLVEDEPTVLNMAEIMLRHLGYNVLAKNSPGEAIELVRNFNDEIHLLITDVVMPEMNGRDLAKKLQTKRSGLKTLFMSGYATPIIGDESVLGEEISIIQKPFSQKELAAIVRQVLGKG